MCVGIWSTLFPNHCYLPLRLVFNIKNRYSCVRKNLTERANTNRSRKKQYTPLPTLPSLPTLSLTCTLPLYQPSSYQCLHHRGLNPDTQLPSIEPWLLAALERPPVVSARCRAPLEELKKKFPLKEAVKKKELKTSVQVFGSR